MKEVTKSCRTFPISSFRSPHPSSTARTAELRSRALGARGSALPWVPRSRPPLVRAEAAGDTEPPRSARNTRHHGPGPEQSGLQRAARCTSAGRNHQCRQDWPSQLTAEILWNGREQEAKAQWNTMASCRIKFSRLQVNSFCNATEHRKVWRSGDRMGAGETAPDDTGWVPHRWFWERRLRGSSQDRSAGATGPARAGRHSITSSRGPAGTTAALLPALTTPRHNSVLQPSAANSSPVTSVYMERFLVLKDWR